jgi:hypothetical protein
LGFVAAWLGAAPVFALPPEYATYQRVQSTAPAIDDRDIMRIWCVYVGQGDGLIIQMPKRFNYDPDGPGPRGADERLDIVVDAGSFEAGFAGEMAAFIRRLYPQSPSLIEHAVLSHHDKDHVAGLTVVLEDAEIRVRRLYHNGLASFAAGARGLPASGKPQAPAVYEFDSPKNRINRALGRLRQDGTAFLSQFVMDDLAELNQSLAQRELQGIYEDFARAIASAQVIGFHRAAVGNPFIPDFAATDGQTLGSVGFELLWPGPELRSYGDWGKTINGNSVTFKLVYGQFEMLFTGDHNEQSEEAMLNEFQTAGTLDRLRADVLKVPHHGSDHGVQGFFDAVSPVVSVASQGPQGAKSKAIGNDNKAWQHPSPEVIRWLGGAHRVYLTHLHERRFDWSTIDTQAELDDLVETKHVLIETNGQWFRIVEVPRDFPTLDQPPTVSATRRSDGTRWISAQ